MDKIIEKKTGWRVAFTKKALPWWLGALLLVFVIYLIARPNNKTLRVDKDTVTISSAVKGEFNDYIRNAVEARDDDTVIHYEKGPYAEYAVPTDDHYLPLIYILGAADPGEKPTVFNNVCNLGALAMTGFAFGI